MKIIHQEQQWREIINRSECYDFYHTWYYHKLEKDSKPVLLLYQNGDDFIAFPFIQKGENSTDLQLASVYGYVGPLSNKRFQDLDDQMLQGFKSKFFSFLKMGGYSLVSARLSPFLDQRPLVSRLGGEIVGGKSVVIDLSISIEEQRKNYRRNLPGAIRKLLQKGYIVKEGQGESAIRTFISIYWENMKRISAEEVYLFDEQYFFDFMNAEDFQAKLFFVYAGDQAIAASIVTLTNGFINGHLIGTRGEYLAESPAKLLVDKISVIGRELGMKYYNLGGGLNFREDHLFQWKCGFSRLFLNSDKWTFRWMHFEQHNESKSETDL